MGESGYDSALIKDFCAGIAQVVEQKTENLCVVGSTPALGTNSVS